MSIIQICIYILEQTSNIKIKTLVNKIEMINIYELLKEELRNFKKKFPLPEFEPGFHLIKLPECYGGLTTFWLKAFRIIVYINSEFNIFNSLRIWPMSLESTKAAGSAHVDNFLSSNQTLQGRFSRETRIFEMQSHNFNNFAQLWHLKDLFLHQWAFGPMREALHLQCWVQGFEPP